MLFIKKLKPKLNVRAELQCMQSFLFSFKSLIVVKRFYSAAIVIKVFYSIVIS